MLMQAGIATNLVYFFAQPGNQWSAKNAILQCNFMTLWISRKSAQDLQTHNHHHHHHHHHQHHHHHHHHLLAGRRANGSTLWSWDSTATAKKCHIASLYRTLQTTSQFNVIMLISIFAQQWPSVGWRAIKHWLESTAIKLSGVQGFNCFSAQFEIVRKTIYLQDRLFITAAKGSFHKLLSGFFSLRGYPLKLSIDIQNSI